MKIQSIFAGLVIAMFSLGAYAQEAQSTQSQTQEQNPASTQEQIQNQNLAQNQNLVRQVQQKLKDEGYTVGNVDGKWGPQTQKALKQYQQAQGLAASGNIDTHTLAALGFSSSEIAAFEQQQQKQQQKKQSGQPGMSQPGNQQQMQGGQGQGSGGM